MDDFVSIVDSRPDNELPKEAVRQSKVLFFKGLLLGACISMCIGGIIQFIIKNFDNSEYVQRAIYIWFNVNEWTWVIGLILCVFLAIKNITRKL